MTVLVYRAGMQSNDREHIDNAAVSVESGNARIFFLERRGYGDSTYSLYIKPESFRNLIEAMVRANTDEAIKAIANVLKDGIPAAAPPSGHLVIAGRSKPSQTA